MQGFVDNIENLVLRNDNFRAVVISAGVQHNIINTSATENLYFYTIYSPAHHPGGTVQKIKQ